MQTIRRITSVPFPLLFFPPRTDSSRLDPCRSAGESVQSGRDASGVASGGLELRVLPVSACREAARGVESGALGPASQVGPAIVIGLEPGPAKLGRGGQPAGSFDGPPQSLRLFLE